MAKTPHSPTTSPAQVRAGAAQDIKPALVLVSHVRKLAADRGWTESDFIGECIKLEVCGLDVAKKIWRGDVYLRVITLAGVAKLFNKTLSDVIEIK